MKSDTERGPVAAWIRRERLAHEWKEGEAKARLEAALPGVSFSSYRDIEAGNRKLTADQRVAIERVFGPMPDFTGDQGAASQAVTAELVASLSAQTEALNRLAAALEQQPNASELTLALRALADVQADQTVHVQRNAERILDLEEAIAARFDEALAAERARPAPHGTRE